MTAVCHCDNCQRQTGTAFSIIVAVPAVSLEFEGQENLKEFLGKGESGSAVQRRFCQNCGSPIVTLADAFPGLGFIKAGTLNDRSWLKPTVNMWCESAQPWVEIDDSLSNFSRNPS
jgi:hypothetical protein